MAPHTAPHPGLHSVTEKLRADQSSLLGRPAPVPIVIVDAPSPLGATAPMLVSLALLGLDTRVGLTDVGELRPFDRSRRLPGLDELSTWLRQRTTDLGEFDIVGIGLGALVALQATLDGAPIRRVVAVDAPSPAYRASDILATEQFYGGALAGASRPLQGVPTAFGSDPVDLAGVAALVPEVRASWWYRSAGAAHALDAIPSIPDARLARFDRPLLCINSYRSDVVTGGDHIARVVPTADLVRVRTTDTADETERHRVAVAVQLFLQGLP